MSDLSEQVIYKLGMIEAKVESGFNSLAKRMDEFCVTTEDQDRRIVELEKMKAERGPQVEQFKKLLNDVENLKTSHTRVLTIGGLVGAFWVPLVGYFVNHL